MQVVIVVEGAVRWKITGAAGQLRERLAPISPTCAVALFGAKQVVQPCIDRLQFSPRELGQFRNDFGGTHEKKLSRPFEFVKCGGAVEWGRWFLADRATRSIAAGFTITPAEAEKLAKEMGTAP